MIKGELKKGCLVGFCCCDRRRCLLCHGTFCCAFSYHSELGHRYVCSARERVTAFFALPNADAFAFNPYETALWAPVRFFEPCNYSDVPFSYRGAVSRSETLCWTYFLCFSSQSFHHFIFLRSSAAFSCASFMASKICCCVK